MNDLRRAGRFRFGSFELDTTTGELRKAGIRIKLHAQPTQVLAMLLERPGEILSREEICRELWPEGTFVDYEHGVNSAVNRLREALGDKAANPRFVETVARRGYRFAAPVERSEAEQETDLPGSGVPAPELSADPASTSRLLDRVLATPEELPKSSWPVIRALFVLLQLMYGAFYVAALANLAEIHEFLAPLRVAGEAFALITATAACLIPVRVFLVCAVLFRAPGFRKKYLRLWPFLLAADAIWALAPFLLHGLNSGLALAATTLLVYAPFAQRSLVLMATRDGAELRQRPVGNGA